MLTETPPLAKSRQGLARRLWQSLSILYAPDRLPFTIIAVGIVFRVAQFLFNRSLWGDEAAVALNLQERNFGQLFEPLHYNQAAPVGFLLLVKVITTVWGNNDLALRVVPFVCGIASLPLFYFVARRLMRPGALPIALVLFATGDNLIYYSSELKQYEGDVTVALLLYLTIYLPLEKPGLFTPLKAIGAGVSGAVLMWFSHPSIFVLAGIGLVLLVRNARNRHWHAIAWLFAPFGLWLVSFGVFYVVSLQAATANEGLLNFHEVYFMPMPPFTPEGLTWLVTNFFFLFTTPGSLGMLAGLGSVCCLIGGFIYYKRMTPNFWALLLPVLFALAASGLHKYSFDGRLLLFLLPALYLLVAEGAFEIREVSRKPAPVVGLVLVGLLVAVPLLGALEATVVPRTKEEIRPVLAYYQANRQPGDTLYVYYGSTAAFSFYQSQMNLGQDCCILGTGSREDWTGYAADLTKLKGRPRVWVVMSHLVNNEQTFFKYYLDSNGKKLDSVEATDAILYLYNLTGK